MESKSDVPDRATGPLPAGASELDAERALSLAAADPELVEQLARAACELRDHVYADRLTFSPKVFLPLTNLCRNRCDYCSFRKSPGDPGAWTMTPGEVQSWIERAHAQGCIEALFCLGDKPEGAFAAYRRTLHELGHDGTVDYLVWAGRAALDLGLLPHTNAGVLSRGDMQRLKPYNVSLGLMLENISPRLCEKGMPHHRAPDKRPARRVQMLEEAGELGIAFTTGILVGIGETRRERIESLLAIRELHRKYGHIQEVIVQNFTPRPEIAMHDVPAQDDVEMQHALAMARLILPMDISLQAPPNLNAERTALLIRSGINDFGGISPVSPDYINPAHPWPHLQALRATCAALGFTLEPRLPVYDAYLERAGFVDEPLRSQALAARERLPLTAANHGLLS
ncbi:MAG TPA: 7,8-didemethyl-8-hydroxy-5-deazariboflavin synthase CofG [Polyangiales bacterium]|nr:7,8-didemethyl-8-hydroxy-5-deazariboflavin synthase CofG [Polyangiales bacterium]